MRTTLRFALLFVPSLLAACVPDYADAPTKLVGVGYDPQEIGPAPTPYGGVVEYSWVNFAGAGLSAAMMGLVSNDEVGPGLAGYEPPYAAVFGFSYVFDTRLEAADSLAGVTSVPPEAEDSCYTSFEAAGPIGSFKTVDVGVRMSLLTEDGLRGMVLDRSPTDYPPSPQDTFVYYIGLDTWAAEPQYGYLPGGTNRREDVSPVVVRRANFPFGETVSFSFPGGMPPATAPVASIPLPSSAAGVGSYALPDAPGSVMLSWTGPRHDAFGAEVASGATSTCLAWPYDDERVPETAEDCADASDLPARGDIEGQMYTGPWEADDGEVTFRWVPGERGDEYVSLAVRFLGPVDEAAPELVDRVIDVESDASALRAWKDAQQAGYIPDDAEIPTGTRAPTPCEDAGEWRLAERWRAADGGYVPALRGNPSHNVAEVTCRLRDDGEFTLSDTTLADALTYARRRGAQGAIFYLARSTEAEVEIPPAKDQYDQRLDITPIKVTSRAIDIGRFWYEEGR